ncbi:hypothetical protein LCGC14_1143020 [marine sediment metagenome]|uniref:Uncharacterized protein n=1 Tax=marine sediment metagenome TaxID=412755 RepID=A0A0F9Q3F6_9ZZZZ
MTLNNHLDNNPPYAKAYDYFMNEQFEILRGHAMRCFQRCMNKMAELKEEHERGLKEK